MTPHPSDARANPFAPEVAARGKQILDGVIRMYFLDSAPNRLVGYWRLIAFYMTLRTKRGIVATLRHTVAPFGHVNCC